MNGPGGAETPRGPAPKYEPSQILLTADVAASAEGTLANTATVSGGQPDPNPGNNGDSATIKVPPSRLEPLTPDPLTPRDVPVQPVSDVKVVKHVDRAAAQVGRRLTSQEARLRVRTSA
ncbi:MAG: hypothetical protein ACOYD4_01575 [Solirubrobacterales bacterium]